MDGWWRRNPVYLRYMLREGTSVLVGAYAAVLLWGLVALASGPEAYAGWLAAMATPLSIAFHLAVLVAAGYHSATWFAVAPKTMAPIRVGARTLPASAIVAGQYVGAGVVSLAILVAVWGGGS
jgi:fumarate reductase subunit C